MTHDEKLAMLKRWHEHYVQLTDAWDVLHAMLGARVESPIGESVWQMFDAYTDVVEQAIGGDCDALSWYIWERPPHAKVKFADGEELEVNTIDDLLAMIEREG
jgi:hypothetical protein